MRTRRAEDLWVWWWKEELLIRMPVLEGELVQSRRLDSSLSMKTSATKRRKRSVHGQAVRKFIKDTLTETWVIIQAQGDKGLKFGDNSTMDIAGGWKVHHIKIRRNGYSTTAHNIFLSKLRELSVYRRYHHQAVLLSIILIIDTHDNRNVNIHTRNIKRDERFVWRNLESFNFNAKLEEFGTVWRGEMSEERRNHWPRYQTVL